MGKGDGLVTDLVPPAWVDPLERFARAHARQTKITDAGTQGTNRLTKQVRRGACGFRNKQPYRDREDYVDLVAGKIERCRHRLPGPWRDNGGIFRRQPRQPFSDRPGSK